MKKLLLLCILLTSAGWWIPGSDDSIPNFNQARGEIFTSGQPTDAGFRQLADLGIRSVINVLPDDECLPGESGKVAPTGMKYYRLPFDPTDLNLETIHHFANLMGTVDRPILIHCSTGNHVGGLWFAYRVLLEHASLPEGIAEGRSIGMRPAMEKKVLEWLSDPDMRADLIRK